MLPSAEPAVAQFAKKAGEQISGPTVFTHRHPMRIASVSGLERVPMCDKCAELDKRIEHYRRMLLSIGDQITVERIEALIADLQAQKTTLHPE